MPIPVLGAPRYEQHTANAHAEQVQAQAADGAAVADAGDDADQIPEFE